METTLDPLLGAGRYRAGVSADCDFSSSEQSEEVLDPSKSAMVTSQKSEDVVGGAALQAGTPGTQSNLPRATPRTTAPGTTSTRRTESTSFETSKLVRHTKLPQGNIKRLSASILLDQESHWEGTGKNRKRVFVPAAPERIKAINDLIAGVIGLDTQRGDRLVIESLPFDRTVETIDPEQPGFKETGKPQNPLEPLLKDKRFLIGAPAASALMLLATSLLFVKRRKKKKNVAMHKALQEAAARKRAAEEANELAQAQKAALIEEMKLPGVPKKLESLRSQVRETVRKDPQLAAEVIRAWLDEPARIP